MAPRLHQKRPNLEQNGTGEGEKELRRSAPAAASKLRVQKQQKEGEALLKSARTEEDASTNNGQREKRREEEREREQGREREEWDRGFQNSLSLFLPGLPESARVCPLRVDQSGTGTGGPAGSRQCTSWAGRQSRAGNEGAAY